VKRFALLSTEEAAKILGKRAITLRKERHYMCGLPYIKFNNGQIRYQLADVEAALQAANNQGGEDDKE
jgi:hypothetical protein